MENHDLLLRLDLFRFDDGGAPASGEATQGTADAPDGSAQPDQGTQAQTAEETPAKATFDDIIKDAEYKAEYDKRVRDAIDKRFKSQRSAQQALQSQIDGMQPIIDLLSERYHVDKDPQKLLAALDGDNTAWEAEAMASGMDVQSYKRLKQMERENARLTEALNTRAKREQAEEKARQWAEQEAQTAQKYPGFDLRAELDNPETGERMLALLKNNVDIQTAYEVIHKDELLSGAVAYAAKTVQQKTINDIRARGMRPQENGAGGGAAILGKPDPSKWTRAEREAISRRVQRGERIEL